MQVTRINDTLELARLATAWDRLARGVPFRLSQWLIPWWRHYGPVIGSPQRQVELFTLAVYDSGELVGLAPWYLERSAGRGRIIRFLGSGEVCSDYLTVLAAPEYRDAVVDVLTDWLSQAGRSSGADSWDMLALAGVERNDPAINRLVGRMYADRASIFVQPAVSTWRIDLPSTWPEFLERLSHSHRKQVRRLERRVLDAGQVVMHTATDEAEMRKAWQCLSTLHQRRMVSVGQCGCFSSPTFTEFHREATTRLFRAGLARLHWFELAGEPIAAEYHLVGGRTIYVYQGGIDPGHLDDEPGRLATIATLRLALEQNYSGFDFCRGNESYKAHWRAIPRKTVDWRIAANRSGARLRQGMWAVRRNALGWVRRRIDALPTHVESQEAIED